MGLYFMDSLVVKIYFFVKYLVPVLIIAGVIFYLSSQAGLGDIENNVIEMFLRKGAHFTEYGLLAFFTWRLFYNGWKFFAISAFWISLILATLYACSDEWHQTFVTDRSGKLIDVLVDFLSIFIVLQFVLFFVKRKIKQPIVKNSILIIVGVLSFLGVVGAMTWQSYVNSKVAVNANNKVNNDIVETIDLDISRKNQQKDRQQDEVSGNNLEKEADEKKNTNDTLIITEKKTLPEKIKHKVPFMVQSPFAKWDELHEEACEESGLIMLKYYNDTLVDNFDLESSRHKFSLNKKIIGEDSFIILKNVAEEEIQKLVKYQVEKYGDFYDTDVKTNKEIGEEYFGLKNLKIIKDFKIADLKRELAKGNIILVPTAGRELKNPYFSGLGPLYHNLVITGYNDRKNVFITNDPGTRKGENYEYNQELLYNAIHDFPGDINKILEGPKRAIVLISEQ